MGQTARRWHASSWPARLPRARTGLHQAHRYLRQIEGARASAASPDDARYATDQLHIRDGPPCRIDLQAEVFEERERRGQRDGVVGLKAALAAIAQSEIT